MCTSLCVYLANSNSVCVFKIIRLQSLCPGSYQTESRMKVMPIKYHPRHGTSREGGQRCRGVTEVRKTVSVEGHKVGRFSLAVGKG